MTAETTRYVIDPYVLEVDETSATIVWVTTAETMDGSVRVRPVDGGTKHHVHADVDAPGFQRVDGPPLDHHRQVARVDGLEPGTDYTYRVSIADGDPARTGSFTTAPPPDHDAFRLAVISDTHTAHDPIARALADDHPDGVVHTGDLTSGRGHDWDLWLSYFESARPYLKSAGLRTVPGGHDIGKGTASTYRILFELEDPDGDPTTLDEEDVSWGRFRFGTAEVFLLDSTGNASLETQFEWLDGALEDSDAEWTIVGLHDSPLVASSSGPALRDRWVEYARILERHAVDLVIGGDCHVYERSLPIGTDGVSPTSYVCIHAGSNHRAVRPSPITAGGIGIQSHNYAVIDVDGDRLTLEVKEADGTVIDDLELINGPDGRYQDEVMEQALDIDLASEIGHIYTGQDRSHDLRYARRDLRASFADFPVDDTPVRMALDVDRFPDGSELIFFEQDDPFEWRIERQAVEITGDRVVVEVTPPADLGTSFQTFQPTVDGTPSIIESYPEFRVTVRIDGREFEPVTLRPSFGIDPTL